MEQPSNAEPIDVWIFAILWLIPLLLLWLPVLGQILILPKQRQHPTGAELCATILLSLGLVVAWLQHDGFNRWLLIAIGFASTALTCIGFRRHLGGRVRFNALAWSDVAKPMNSISALLPRRGETLEPIGCLLSLFLALGSGLILLVCWALVFLWSIVVFGATTLLSPAFRLVASAKAPKIVGGILAASTFVVMFSQVLSTMTVFLTN